jgi:hypothetical protein
MRLFRLMIVPALLFLPSSARAAGVPNDCEQLIVAIAPDWNSMRGELQRFERSAFGPWHRVGVSVPVLFGKNGLAWGRGLAGQDGRPAQGRESGTRPFFQQQNLHLRSGVRRGNFFIR